MDISSPDSVKSMEVSNSLVSSEGKNYFKLVKFGTPVLRLLFYERTQKFLHLTIENIFLSDKSGLHQTPE